MTGQLPWQDAAFEAKAVDAIVHVTRQFPVRREEVFAAWTDPQLLAQWFRPMNSSTSAELDVRPGGEYRITMRLPPGLPGPVHIVGTYLEVLPPERLVYTFGWEVPPVDEPGDLEQLDDLDSRIEALGSVDSRVTVLFGDLEGSTEVSITHERLDTRNLRAFHIFGWESTLDKLAEVL
jgi:uncharacterized protein YndB with AHSA1/START domain